MWPVGEIGLADMGRCAFRRMCMGGANGALDGDVCDAVVTGGGRRDAADVGGAAASRGAAAGGGRREAVPGRGCGCRCCGGSLPAHGAGGMLPVYVGTPLCCGRCCC